MLRSVLRTLANRLSPSCPRSRVRRPAPSCRPRVEALEERSLLTFSPPMHVFPGSPAAHVATGDFDWDGKLDLVTVSRGGTSVAVMLGNGNGSFRGFVSYAVGETPSFVAVADFNRDGNPDLVVANPDERVGGEPFAHRYSVGVLLGNGDGTFQDQREHALSRPAHTLAVADFNGDGRLDLATVSPTDGRVGVLLGNGDGGFQPGQDYQTGVARPWGITTGDFNRDGKLDLAMSVYSGTEDGIVTVALGNGDGTFRAGETFGVGSRPGDVLMGDFNADGKPDLAVSNQQSASVSILLGNGDGTFQSKRDFAVGGQRVFSTGTWVNHSVLGDFNRDGNLDVAVAKYGSNTLSLLLGNGDGTLRAGQEFAAGDRPFCLTGGDVNGDGRTDLIAGSLGFTGPSVLLNLEPASPVRPTPLPPPVVAPILSARASVRGATVTSTSFFTSANPRGHFTAIWNWGDGTQSVGVVSAQPGGGSVLGNHAYRSPGRYTIQLTVTDSDGNSTTVTRQITIRSRFMRGGFQLHGRGHRPRLGRR